LGKEAYCALGLAGGGGGKSWPRRLSRFCEGEFRQQKENQKDDEGRGGSLVFDIQTKGKVPLGRVKSGETWVQGKGRGLPPNCT